MQCDDVINVERASANSKHRTHCAIINEGGKVLVGCFVLLSNGGRAPLLASSSTARCKIVLLSLFSPTAHFHVHVWERSQPVDATPPRLLYASNFKAKCTNSTAAVILTPKAASTKVEHLINILRSIYIHAHTFPELVYACRLRAYMNARTHA